MKKLLKHPELICLGIMCLLMCLLMVYFNYKYQVITSQLDNTTARGIVTDVLCDSDNKCVAGVVWYDTKKKELISLNKGETYNIAEDYVYHVSFTKFQKLGLIPPNNVPSLNRYHELHDTIGILGPMNGLLFLFSFLMGLVYCIAFIKDKTKKRPLLG